MAREHAADVERELESLLLPRLARARRREPQRWHAALPLAVWIPLVSLATWNSPAENEWFNSGWSPINNMGAHPELFWQAVGLTVLSTGFIASLFFVAMELPARARERRLRRRFGAPPSTWRAADRLPELTRRLAALRELDPFLGDVAAREE